MSRSFMVHCVYVLVWSKSDQRRLWKTLHKQTNKQTNKQTDKPTDTTKIMVTWPSTNIGDGFLWVRWPNQQCQSIEGSSSPKDRLQSHQVHLTMLQYYIVHMHAMYTK